MRPDEGTHDGESEPDAAGGRRRPAGARDAGGGSEAGRLRRHRSRQRR
ncbi:MAG: hypothetical protein MZV64_48625 [Ignavibacteriales bacterium]|nr:hypothetical protein [Ignavibacteriales bacterium]